MSLGSPSRQRYRLGEPSDVGDYLDGERNAKRKYEYVHGVVYAMAGANNLQNRIASNAKSGFGITLALGSTILTYRLFVIQTAIQIRNAINRLS
jgi:hypothetical protein